MILSRKSFIIVTGLLLLAFTGFLGGCAEQQRPNIILITLDTLRADRLGPWGGPDGLSPRIDELAEQGTVFGHAVAATGTTFPSHASMLTGLYPRIHGVRSNRHTLPEAFPTVAEKLAASGYRTGAFVSFRQMLYRGRLDQGFQAVSDESHRKDQSLFRDGAETTAMAIDWLTNADVSGSGDPVFLWLHLYDPHGPYRLNDWSRERLGDYDGILKDGATMELLLDQTAKIRDSEEDLRALEILYNGEVVKTDRHVGELLDALDAVGELDESVVIVTADHGQAIGKNGRMGHGPVLWEEVLRVPLIIADMRRPESRRVDATVGHTDLAPTMLAYAGLDPDWQMQARDLKPTVEGQPLETAPYFAEVELKEGAGDWYDKDHVAVYDNRFKLEFWPEGRILYDLEADPLAQEPIDASGHPAEVDYLSGLAQDHLATEADFREADLSKEDLETLKSLGYIQ